MNDTWKAINLFLILILSLSLIFSLFSPSEATLALLFFIIILAINVNWSIKVLLTIATFDWLNYGIGFIGELCLILAFLIHVYFWNEKKKVIKIKTSEESTLPKLEKIIEFKNDKYKRGKEIAKKLKAKEKLKHPETHEIKEENILNSKVKVLRKKTKDKENKKSEVVNFFNDLEDKFNNKIPHDSNPGFHLDSANFHLFHSFISNTKESLDIITAFLDEILLAEMLYPLRNKPIRIRIIRVTKNVKNPGYLDYLSENSKLSIETKNMSRNHSKMMIRDYERIIIGSSNITEASMSKKELNYDANFLSEDKNDVNLAQKIFDSIWNQQNIIKDADENNSSLLYTKRSRSQLPKIIESLAKSESNEIVLLFNSGLIDRRIVEQIRSYNSYPKIRIVTNKTWQDETMNEVRKETIETLKHLSKNEENGIRVLPKDSWIHAKVYIFKSQNIALVSSQNLTVNSWYLLFENGYIIKDEKTVKRIMNCINEMPDSEFDSIEYNEIEKPTSTWTDSTSEGNLKIPWEICESNPDWKIDEDNQGSFYRVVKNIRKETLDDETRVDHEKVQTYERPVDEEWQEFKETHPYPKDRILKLALFMLQKAEINNLEEADRIREFIENHKSIRRKKRRSSKNNTAFNEEVLKRLREAGLDPSKLK